MCVGHGAGRLRIRGGATANAVPSAGRLPVKSPELPISLRAAVIVLAEASAIWTPHGVGVRLAEPSDEDCDRLIALKSDQEARPEDASSDAALGWVPFVAGQARQLVFIRACRARTLIEALGGVPRPDALTELMIAKLLGRSLAHELGHVLLNSQRHESLGPDASALPRS